MCPINDDIVTRILRRKLDSARVNLLGWELADEEDVRKFNFNSCALRFAIRYEFEGKELTEWFFAKVPIRSKAFGRNKQMGFLQNELIVYEVVLPHLNRVADHLFAPVLYHSCKTNYTLIMDDLTSAGYEADFDQQFGFEEGCRVLQELAKFHAASAKVLQLRADLFDWLNTEFVRRSPYFQDEIGKQRIGNRFQKVVLRVDPGFWYENCSQLEDYKSHLFESNMVERLSQQNPLNVLNHGDCWKTNIMVKYNGGAVESVKFVDFQGSVVASPAVDVFSFVMSSVRFEVFEENGDQLLETYVRALNKWLLEFDCGVLYSTDELQKEIDGRSSFWMYQLVFWMPILFSKPEVIREKTAGYDGLVDGEPYATIADKWMTYFIRRSKEHPEFRIFCKNK